jgi:hypothetical protein
MRIRVKWLDWDLRNFVCGGTDFRDKLKYKLFGKKAPDVSGS